MSRHRSGGRLIADERRRQVVEEGYTVEADAVTGADELALAAVAYLLEGIGLQRDARRFWPFDPAAFKPTHSDIARDWVKAGALTAAAIDALYEEAPE